MLKIATSPELESIKFESNISRFLARLQNRGEWTIGTVSKGMEFRVPADEYGTAHIPSPDVDIAGVKADSLPDVATKFGWEIWKVGKHSGLVVAKSRRILCRESRLLRLEMST